MQDHPCHICLDWGGCQNMSNVLSGLHLFPYPSLCVILILSEPFLSWEWFEPQSTQWSQWVDSLNTKKLPASEQCLQGQQGLFSEEKSKDKSLVSCSNFYYCKFCGNSYRNVSSYKLEVLWWSSNYKKKIWQETLPMASDVVFSVHSYAISKWS